MTFRQSFRVPRQLLLAEKLRPQGRGSHRWMPAGSSGQPLRNPGKKRGHHRFSLRDRIDAEDPKPPLSPDAGGCRGAWLDSAEGNVCTRSHATAVPTVFPLRQGTLMWSSSAADLPVRTGWVWYRQNHRCNLRRLDAPRVAGVHLQTRIHRRDLPVDRLPSGVLAHSAQFHRDWDRPSSSWRNGGQCLWAGGIDYGWGSRREAAFRGSHYRSKSKPRLWALALPHRSLKTSKPHRRVQPTVAGSTCMAGAPDAGGKVREPPSGFGTYPDGVRSILAVKWHPAGTRAARC